jgi:hypothetical protein
MNGFRSIKKTVILQSPTIKIAILAIADILFLTKLQKRENQLNGLSLMIT